MVLVMSYNDLSIILLTLIMSGHNMDRLSPVYTTVSIRPNLLSGATHAPVQTWVAVGKWMLLAFNYYNPMLGHFFYLCPTVIMAGTEFS